MYRLLCPRAMINVKNCTLYLQIVWQCLHLGEVLPGPGVLGVQLLDVGVDLREPLGDGGGVPLPAPLRMAADVQHGPRIFLIVTNIFECHKYFGSGDKYNIF